METRDPRTCKTIFLGEPMLKNKKLFFLLPLLSFLVYAPSLFHFFVSDDFFLIEAVKSDGPLGIWTSAGEMFFRPIISITVWINYHLFGLNPFGYHLTNLIFHAANSVLVGVLFFLLWNHFSKKPTSPLIAGLVGLFYSLLLSHDEAVIWISGRTDIFATFFSLVSIVSFVKYLENYSKKYLVISLVSVFFGLLSKESVVLIGLLYFILLLFHFRHNLKSSFKTILILVAPFVIISIVYVLIRSMVLGTLIGGYPIQYRSFMIWNIKFIMISLLPQHDWFETHNRIISSVLLILFSIMSYLSWKKGNRITLLVPVLFFALSVVLYIPALPYGVSFVTHEGGRFLYLPSIAWVIGFAWMLSIFSQKIQSYTLIVLICIYSVLQLSNIEKWTVASDISLEYLECVQEFDSSQQIISLNPRDNYIGAYIYRNGLENAVRLFDETPPDIIVSDSLLLSLTIDFDLASETVCYDDSFYLKNGLIIEPNDPDSFFTLKNMLQSK
jgi:protein O-mannosyl-transferase